MGIEKRANAFPDFEIGHFLIFLQKKVVFLVSSGGNVILPFLNPCKNIFDPPLENPLLALP